MVKSFFFYLAIIGICIRYIYFFLPVTLGTCRVNCTHNCLLKGTRMLTGTKADGKRVNGWKMNTWSVLNVWEYFDGTMCLCFQNSVLVIQQVFVLQTSVQKCTVCPCVCIHETSAVWLREYSLLLLLVVLIVCYQQNCCPNWMTWIATLLEGQKEPPPPDWKNFSNRSFNQ